MARYPTEHKQATRRRILAASEKLLKDRGAEGATVEAVMRAAGLTVGGFYAHFPSKEALKRILLPLIFGGVLENPISDRPNRVSSVLMTLLSPPPKVV